MRLEPLLINIFNLCLNIITVVIVLSIGGRKMGDILYLAAARDMKHSRASVHQHFLVLRYTAWKMYLNKINKKLRKI